MSLISEIPGRLVSLVLRLVFGLAAAIFAVSLLAAGLIAVLFMLLRALLTGQKPAPVMVWQRYRAASQASSARWSRPAEPGATAPVKGLRAAPADVTDVTPRDVPPH